MGASFDHEEGGEWEVVEDLEYDLCGSFETSLSLSAQKHGTRPLSRHNSGALSNTKSQASRDFSIRPQFYASVVSFEMAPNLTAEQVDEAREHNRMAARAKSLAWAFGGVHKSDKHREASSMPGNSASHEYAEDDRERLRAEYLAWMFGGVHINNAHEDWDNLSAKDKEALKAKLAQGRSDEQMSAMWRGIKIKSFYVTTKKGGREPVRVIEDSGSAYNWISREQMELFGLSYKRGSEISSITLTGEKFSADKYVEVSWIGRNSRNGTDRFYIAPEKTPIDMVVGCDFTEKHPGVFMDQEPPGTAQFLTLQSRPKADEQSRIDAGRTRMEGQANMLERRRREQRQPAPPSRADTQSSTTSSGQATLVPASNTGRKRSFK